MANLNEPVISEIARAHFFVCVIVWRILRVNYDMPVVVRRARVSRSKCPPPSPDGMDSQPPAGRVRFVSKNLANLENACRRATVALFLSKTLAHFAPRARCPRRARLFKQHRMVNSRATAPARTRVQRAAAHPRMEFHVGAIPTMSCVAVVRNTIGAHNCKALLSRKTAMQREIGMQKGTHFHNFATCFHICGRQRGDFRRFYHFEVNPHRV